MIIPYEPYHQAPLLELLGLNTPRYFHPEEAVDYKNYLEREREDYWIYQSGNRLLGAGGINYFPAEKKARLSWDMVHPKQQGQGIGKELVSFRLRHLRANPAPLAWVEVRTSQLVYPFYQKMGFDLEEVKEDYWAPGFHLYRMLCRL